jgi:triacylglycerol esterase/lipase EstA (alpha/beta hydrolase family)
MTFNPLCDDLTYNENNFAVVTTLTLKSEGKKLLGTIFAHSGSKPRKTILLLHGFPGSEFAYDLGHIFLRAGWNVVSFHYRGTWGSEGEFTFQNAIDDVKNVLNILHDDSLGNGYHVDPQKIVMVGHSFGGFSALKVLSEQNMVNYAAAIAPFNIGTLGTYLREHPEFLGEAESRMDWSANFIRNSSGKKLVADMVSHEPDFNLISFIPNYKQKKILFIGGEYDNTSEPIFHYYPFLDAFRNYPFHENLTSKLLKDNHSFANTRIELAATIIEWLKKIEPEF